MKLSVNKIITLTLASMMISACAPGGFDMASQLPDDPQDESSAVDNGENGSSSVVPPTTPEVTEPAPNPGSGEDAILAKYDYVDPENIVPTKHLKAAILYYDANLSKIKNKNYLSVLDFSKSSTQKRFFLIDMKTGAVAAYHVSHGKGSDSNHDGYAEKFSNTEGSNASSLGFYMTAETYNGSNGYSLRLDGLSKTNSNARSRAVVIHGADYVEDRNRIQGRSWGCPAFSQANKTKIINTIKGGSIIYAMN
ncbi:murein L,D-transpeptidase catalytic domain family protein [Bdellovibrio sp. HCB2-146]|uniref:murein L,D-transpeptidase catalytic domain family protein n=1 Tax=Bdellovibrio sp. HCB2-146 TaxID=3394362 RepID=UPI0039BC6E60